MFDSCVNWVVSLHQIITSVNFPRHENASDLSSLEQTLLQRRLMLYSALQCSIASIFPCSLEDILLAGFCCSALRTVSVFPLLNATYVLTFQTIETLWAEIKQKNEMIQKFASEKDDLLQEVQKKDQELKAKLQMISDKVSYIQPSLLKLLRVAVII